MKCPHCLVSFHAVFAEGLFLMPGGGGLEDAFGRWKHRLTVCPACNKAIIFLKLIPREKKGYRLKEREIMVWPRRVARSPLPPEVTEPFVSDYREACNVLAESAKASAALSRRVLQHLLRDKAGVKKSDLSNEIDQVLKSKTLPSDLADAVDAIRNLGNFAAHPLKSTNTGQILDVEPGEAEWLLDVLEALFDFYFLRPAQLAKKRAALDKKLANAGKPPMKKG